MRRPNVIRWAPAVVLLVTVIPAVHGDGPAVRAETTVGMTGRLEEVVLPGPELEPKPYDDRKLPVVLRIAAVHPHGTGFRYDLEYYGLDPGTYDLRDYLRRKDGGPTSGLPPLPVKVVPLLPPGQVEPNTLQVEPGPRVGGYRVILVVAAAVWVLGLLALTASFFFPRRRDAATEAERPVSLADRLRPLVEGAIAGTLSRTELAGLERALLSFWRKRLVLENADPVEAIAELRRHPDAGPLLDRLEDWLHKPGSPEAVDVAELLRPYRGLPPDAADLTAAEPGEAAAR